MDRARPRTPGVDAGAGPRRRPPVRVRDGLAKRSPGHRCHTAVRRKRRRARRPRPAQPSRQGGLPGHLLRRASRGTPLRAGGAHGRGGPPRAAGVLLRALAGPAFGAVGRAARAGRAGRGNPLRAARLRAARAGGGATMSETYDVAIVGAGLAGMSAAVFAANRGLRVVQVGNAGALLFASGLLDLLGVHPIEEGCTWSDPWAGLTVLARDLPSHPYAKLEAARMRAAFAELTTALDETGLAYTAPGERNHEVLTGVGTVKSTYCLPCSMQPGAAALAAGVPCLLVDFEGLREYSAKAVAAGAAARWPGVRTLRLTFPAPGIA